MSNHDSVLKTTPQSKQPGVISRYPEPMHGVLDPSVTGIAVELTLPQNHVNAETIEPYLQSLRGLVAVDCVFVALFDEAREKIEWINSVSNKYDLCNPFVLLKSPQPCCDRVKTRLATRQLLEIRDTSASDVDYTEFNTNLASLNLGSMLVAGLSCNNGSTNDIAGVMVLGTMRRRSRWDMDTHLMLKLMASSYAAGYERYLLNPVAYLHA